MIALIGRNIGAETLARPWQVVGN